MHKEFEINNRNIGHGDKTDHIYRTNVIARCNRSTVNCSRLKDASRLKFVGSRAHNASMSKSKSVQNRCTTYILVRA